jgi:hypothetical protein
MVLLCGFVLPAAHAPINMRDDRSPTAFRILHFLDKLWIRWQLRENLL